MIIERLRLLERCLIENEKDKEREKTKRCRGQSEKGLQFDGLLSACGYRGTTERPSIDVRGSQRVRTNKMALDRKSLQQR